MQYLKQDTNVNGKAVSWRLGRSKAVGDNADQKLFNL